jgi:hypothetical protein
MEYHELKLKASPAGGPMIMMTVIVHCTDKGPIGVPRGLVDVQNLGQGRSPCLLEIVSPS